ncbi:hypothetical protein HJB51_28845 [Rhizobium lentis]|uniref:hypothetical protein n=1 Tax=Rhizobium lentis TaxID=1138194 RepID=UPI001C838DF1|nr:hypothetical protein [Rhizobium lentis]MBX5111940.1 hypothetical protein [Rhizobium lentis]
MRVMRDTTAMALATKLFNACGSHCDSYVSDTTNFWNGVVKAWSVGSTRALHDEDLYAIVVRIQSIEEAREEQLKYADEDEVA